MRMHSKKYRPRPSLTINMAPMIDVVFLLIVFFVLVSTFASAERVDMSLPAPERSQAINKKLTDRVIINIQLLDPNEPETTTAVFSIGANPPEPLEDISARLAMHRRAVPKLKAVIRADRRVRYADVRDVMEVVASNGIEMMNIGAVVGDSGGKP
jgi:biopolymer transport protein ExbD